MQNALVGYSTLGEILKITFPGGRERYFAMVVKVLDSFLDESADQEQKDIFCVAAFLAREDFWKALEIKWIERLTKDGVKYFRTSDCKAVRGPFDHLRRVHGSFPAAKKVADALRADLENILVSPSSHWHGFSLGVVIPEYKAILEKYPISRRFYAKNPTVAAYSQIMYEVVHTVRRKAPRFGVAYFVDDSTYSDRIRRAFEGMKINHPVIGMSAKTCAPLDDKETPALQMADLVANASKDIFLKWLEHGGERVDLGKWDNHIERLGKWDAEHMSRSLLRTLQSPRFEKGTLARLPAPQSKMTSRERKRMRRALVKDLATRRSGS